MILDIKDSITSLFGKYYPLLINVVFLIGVIFFLMGFIGMSKKGSNATGLSQFSKNIKKGKINAL